MRIRRDTATPDADLLRSRFSELELTQTEFVTGRGFTLRTFQRALAGVTIAKVALRKIAEALSLPYEQIVVAHGPRHRMAGDVTGFGCRPTRTPPRAHLGRRSKAAREGRRGLWGTRLSGRYGDLAGAVGAASALCSRQRCRR